MISDETLMLEFQGGSREAFEQLFARYRGPLYGFFRRRQVVPPSTTTRLSNAAVEGYRSMVDGVVTFALFVSSNGPSLLLWAAVLFFPARFAWKKLRRQMAG